MQDGIFSSPFPRNEHVHNYAPDCPETGALAKELARQGSGPIEIPIIIGGEEIRTRLMGEIRSPHNHKTLLAIYHKASPAMVDMAAQKAVEARTEVQAPEVINFGPGDGASVGGPAIASRHFAGLHFTGSTSTFNAMWVDIAKNLAANRYKVYPRIVGETGGKNFLIAHEDCDVQALAVALFRGAFEYQGQKCSATSRAYIPRSIWPKVRDKLVEFAESAAMGDVADFSIFMGAVIDKKAFRNIASYIDYVKAKPEEYKFLVGGDCDDSEGWFIPATIIETNNPAGKLMTEEIFGPILTIYVYDGDKATGAVVGQQPFGGARASGTNDKAGSFFNLMRWTSVRTVKENFLQAETWDYPHQRLPGYREPKDIG